MEFKNPYSLLFNGSSSYVTFANKITSSGAKTIRFKVKSNSLPTANAVIFSNKSGSAEKGITARIQTDGTLYIYIANGSGTANTILILHDKTKNICDGQWHDVAFTWDGSTKSNSAKLYIDNMNVPSVVATASSVDGTPTRNMEFGKVAGVTTQYYGGYLDDIEFWNRELSSNELIANSYKLQLEITNGLTNHYRFDEDGLIRDLVGGMDGTAYNLIWSNDTFDYLRLNKILLLSSDGVKSFKSTYEDAIPPMTSNTTPSGIASASSFYSTLNPYKAFDKKVDNANRWTASSTTGWLSYSFTESVVISKYSINVLDGSGGNQAPKNWRLEGSNDGGSTWDILDTQTNQTGWGQGETREFYIPNTNKYKDYKVVVTANNGNTSYVAINELVLYKLVYYFYEIPSHSKQNFINHGMNSVEGLDGIFSNKNYILTETDSKDANGLWTTQINRKPLSIKFN